jgi:ABC-2 type transport system permease protein
VRERLRRAALRVGAMAWKETLHVLRDPRTLLLALAMPVLLLLLFGYGISFDVDRIPLAVADGDRTAASRRLVRAYTEPHEFEPVAAVEPEGAEPLLRQGQALAALVVPRGFSRELDRGGSGGVQLLVDGADGVIANQVLAKSDAIALAASQARLGAAGSSVPPLSVAVWTRFNPEARSALFMVPGLAAFLLAIGAVLLTALTIAGEWERGSMEQLFASPLGRIEIVVGKLLPYLVLGMLQFLLVLSLGTFAFDVPVRGGVLLLFAFGLLFLLGMLGQGLLISVLAKSQLVATQAGALSSLLPSLLLSGLLFPVENMPAPLRALSAVIPARYLVRALRGILLKGAGLDVLWPDLVAQVIFAAAVVALAVVRFKRRLA